MILKLYRSGLGAIEVARRAQVGSTTVYRVLDRAGVARRFDEATQDRLRAISSPADRRDVARKYAAGWTLPRLAAKYGCSRSSVRKVLVRQGVSIRSRGQAPKRLDLRLVQRVLDARAKGLSQIDIARRVGQTQGWISRILRESGEPGRAADGRAGRMMTGGGYVRVLLSVDDPMLSMADHMGRCLEHRLILARELGRPLSDDETVHHLDGNKTNNRPGNLQLRHGRHGAGVVLYCAKCGSHDLVHEEL
jgi:DNA-binding phage protein